MLLELFLVLPLGFFLFASTLGASYLYTDKNEAKVEIGFDVMENYRDPERKKGIINKIKTTLTQEKDEKTTLFQTKKASLKKNEKRLDFIAKTYGFFSKNNGNDFLTKFVNEYKQDHPPEAELLLDQEEEEKDGKNGK